MADFKEKRRHQRARIKWPVVVNSPNGLLDGKTRDLSVGGTYIRCPDMPILDTNFLLVITAEERLILVTAEMVWSDTRNSDGKNISRGMGIRFRSIKSEGRVFLHSAISNRPKLQIRKTPISISSATNHTC